ncbi:hypothetical protein C5142_16325 [Rhodococcus sp. BGS-1C]|uniref:hypothetical protein n=1 Tax=Rhodococcus sp. BGS-1C TaxID=2100132 RepID=UPI003DA10FB1
MRIGWRYVEPRLVRHLAASGSHDSVHIVLAPPTPWARTHLTNMIDELRVWASYDTRAVYVLTPALY